MRKTIFAFAAFAFAASVCNGQEKAPAETEKPAPVEQTAKAPWPVWLQFNSTDNLDVAGVRFNIPYGVCDEVTGLDCGFFGRVHNMYGLQANILRNDATDTLAGVQVGIWNSAGRADAISVQAGLWNETGAFTGLQVGAINIAGAGEGGQFGLINRCETLHGYQLGLINIIRSSKIQFMPILNVGF